MFKLKSRNAYAGPVPTYCAAVRLTFDFVRRKLAHLFFLRRWTFTPILIFCAFSI